MFSLADVCTIVVAVLCCIYRDVAPILIVVWGAALYLGHKWDKASKNRAGDAAVNLHLRREATAQRPHQVYYLPSTAVESGDFLNKLLATIWPTFMEPKIIKKMGAKVGKKIQENSPENMDVNVDSLTLGSAAPHLSGFQAFSDSEGRLTHLDLNLDFASSQLAIAISALVKTSTVSVKSSVTVHKINISGKVRVYPFKHERLLLWGFREAPDATLQLRVKGPGGVEAEVGGFSFLEKALRTVLKKKFTLPATKAVGLEINELGKDVLGARIAVRVASVSGPPSIIRDSLVVEVQVEKTTRQARREVETPGEAPVDKTLGFQLNGRDGQVVVRVLAASGQSSSSSSNRRLLGSCSFLMEHMADASTAFWGYLRDGAPVAKRLITGTPWKVRLPLEELQDVEVALEASVKGWEYGTHGTLPSSRAPSGPGGFVQGGRSILIHVIEGKDLPAQPRHRLDPIVKIKYGVQTLATSNAGRTLTPFWDEVFTIEENMYSKKLDLEVCDARQGSKAIGTALIRLEALEENVPSDLQLHLAGAGTGELSVRALVVPGAPGDAMVEREAERMRSRFGSLVVGLTRGVDLAKRDRFGTSDPYIVVIYGASQHRTRIIKANINPLWQEQVKLPFRHGEELLLEVFDWDRSSNDDFMGRARVPAHKIASFEAGEEVPVVLQLTDVESGTLHITLKRTDASSSDTDADEDEALDSPSPRPSGPRKTISSGSSMMAAMASGLTRKAFESLGSFSSPGGSRTGSGTVQSSQKPREEEEQEPGAMALEIESLRAELENKGKEVSSLEKRHAATIKRMKKDQDCLLAKVQELEDVLSTL